jgi:hypothetical protein
MKVLINFIFTFLFTTIFLHGQSVHVKPYHQDTSNIKTYKLISNKQEPKENFKDTSQFQLMPYELFPQTHVYIAPPKNFKPVESVRGFINLVTTTSITCTEINGYHYTKLVENLSAEDIAKQNAVLVSTEDVTTENGMPAKLLTISFTIQGMDSTHKDVPFERLMLFTGSLEKTVWLNATYPVAVKRFNNKIVRKSLLSVKIDNQKN